MDQKSRLALHHRLSEGMIEAFSRSVERRRVEMPPEFVLSDDAVVWAPMIYGQQEHRYDEEFGEIGGSPSERTTHEFRTYWTVLPDFQLAAHGLPFVTDDGFAVWFRFEGTTAKGRTVGFYEMDFVQTNTRGEISRMETFHDLRGLGEVLELFGVQAEDGWQALRDLRSRTDQPSRSDAASS